MTLRALVSALVLTFMVCVPASGGTVGGRRNLPLLAQDFEEAPLPFGASLGVMSVSQEFKMENVRVDGRSVEVFTVSSARGTNNILMPKLDMWLFPFLDVYAFGGFTSGTMNMDVTLFDFPLLGDTHLPLDFEFDGGTLGAGLTLAGGYGPVFAMVDANYSRVSVSTLDSKLDMIMASGRLGTMTSGDGWRAMYWLGGMLQDVDQYLEEVTPLGDTGRTALVGVDVGVKDPWNMAVGTRLQAGERLALTTETGFFGRRILFANLEYRF